MQRPAFSPDLGPSGARLLALLFWIVEKGRKKPETWSKQAEGGWRRGAPVSLQSHCAVDSLCS